MAPSHSASGYHAPYGKRLLPQIVDDLARETPERPWCILPQSSKSYADGQRIITYAQIARAVDRFAWFVEEHLGTPSRCETLAYIGPNDIRYAISAIGAIKAGYKMLFTSPRNSVSNHLNLIEKTHCATFLKDKSVHVDHIVAAHSDPLHVIDLPGLEYFLTEGDHKPYLWTGAYEDLVDQEVLVLHSSGSTGQVKPIPMTHGSWAAMDRQHELPAAPGLQPLWPSMVGDGHNTIFVPMPLFHGAAIFIGVLLNTFYQMTYVAPPPEAPLNVPTVLTGIEKVKPTYTMMAPSILEEMTEDPDALKILGIPKMVIYGGGALSDYAGDVISKHTRLQSFIGTTEAGAYPLYAPDDPGVDYPYIRLDPDQGDIDFRRQDNDSYKMILIRGSGKQLVWSSIFHTFPDKKEYDTSDLYWKHPTKPGFWKHAGRDDDVIVLSNGEKVVPSTLEYILHQSPDLHEVLLYGSKRFQVAAIIELEAHAQNLSHGEALERLNPYIKKANENMPSHAQLSNDFVLFTPANKRLTRTPKGTVARNASFKNFEMELDALYNDSGDTNTSSSHLIKDVDESGTVRGLISLFARAVDLPDFPANEDFLSAGVDSLSIITLVRNIKNQLKNEGAEIPLAKVNNTLVYNNPTINALAKSLRNLGSKVSDEAEAKQRTKAMEDMFQKYSAYLPASPLGPAPVFSDNLTVILTGSTGSLGCYLLAGLLANPAVSKVYALNRSADGRATQEAAFEARGLEANFGHRVAFHRMEVGKPRLGLDKVVYDSIVAKVDVILHNAWPVNFNIPLSSFEPHVAGMRTLVNLAIAAPSRPALLFTSSVGTATNWPEYYPKEPVPEHLIADPLVPGGAYGGSKWIAERILDKASQVSGVRGVNVRVGQLAGSVSTKSNWNKWEWFPSIIQSSAYLGVLPESLGAMDGIDFVPLDRAASILLELALGSVSNPKDDQSLVFNMVNPKHMRFEPFVPLIKARLEKASGKSVKVVPFAEWLQALRKSTETTQDADVEQNPGIKLADWYGGLLPEEGAVKGESTDSEATGFETTELRKRSQTMRGLEGVKNEWLEAWLEGLGF